MFEKVHREYEQYEGREEAEMLGVEIITQPGGQLLNTHNLTYIEGRDGGQAAAPADDRRAAVRRTALKRLFEIMYADDVMVVGTSEGGLQVMMEILDRVVTSFGQQISPKKTKVMVMTGAAAVPAIGVPIQAVDGEGNPAGAVQLDNVTSFNYLGSTSNAHGGMDDEIARRTRSMCYTFGRLRDTALANPLLRVTTKYDLYVAAVLGVGLYGCAAWVCTQAQLDKVEGMHFRFLRRIIPGAKWDTPKEAVIKMAAEHGTVVEPVSMIIDRRILLKAGKVVMKDDTDFLREIVLGRHWGDHPPLYTSTSTRNDLPNGGSTSAGPIRRRRRHVATQNRKGHENTDRAAGQGGKGRLHETVARGPGEEASRQEDVRRATRRAVSGHGGSSKAADAAGRERPVPEVR